jgi:hypothetical protein
MLKQHLHTHTDAEHRATPGKSSPYQHVSAYATDALHARLEGTHPGDDQTIGSHRCIEVSCDGDLCACALQRTLGRANVA